MTLNRKRLNTLRAWVLTALTPKPKPLPTERWANWPSDCLFNAPNVEDLRSQRDQLVLVLNQPTPLRRSPTAPITYDGEESTRRLLALCNNERQTITRYEQSKRRT